MNSTRKILKGKTLSQREFEARINGCLASFWKKEICHYYKFRFVGGVYEYHFQKGVRRALLVEFDAHSQELRIIFSVYPSFRDVNGSLSHVEDLIEVHDFDFDRNTLVDVFDYVKIFLKEIKVLVKRYQELRSEDIRNSKEVKRIVEKYKINWLFRT